MMISLSQEVSLYVVTPPMFLNSSESQQRFLSGTAARLFCFAGGEPEPSVTWRRSDGRTINLQHRGSQNQSEGGVLQLGAVTRRDSGDYLCIASNNYPPPIVKTIRLNVMCE